MSPSISMSSLTASLQKALNRTHIDRVLDYSNIVNLYKGIERRYVLFWENNKPSLYDYVTGNGNSGFNNTSLATGRRLLKDQAVVFVSGPQVYQRLFKLDVSEEEIPEWIIGNRHRIWPVGIDDDSLEFSYACVKSGDSNYIYICFLNRDTLQAIETYCENNQLVPSIILPRASMLVVDDKLRALDSLSNTRLIRGQIIESIGGENGGYRITPQQTDDGQSSDIPRIVTQDTGEKQVGLNGFENSLTRDLNLSSSTITKFSNTKLSRLFKGGLYAFLSLLIVFIMLNVYLSVKESQHGGVLAEIEILESNTNHLEKNISDLEKELTVYANLFNGKTTDGLLLSDIANLKPEKLWLRYFEVKDNFQGDNTVVIKGYSVDRTVVSEFVSALESSDNIKSASITSLNHQTEKMPDDIPSRFHDQLYRFSISLEVKR